MGKFKAGNKVGNQIKKGEVRNPNGRPKNIVNSLIKTLKNKGYKPLSPSQAKDALLICLTLKEEELESLQDNKECPMFVRIAATNLLSNDSFKTLEAVLDRAHGKPKQTTDENVNMNINKLPQIKWADDSE